MKHIVIAAAMLAVFGAAIASAQTEPPTKPTVPPKQHVDPVTNDASWDDMDVNKDGYITKDELKSSPAILHRFDALDTDHDNKVSPAEWKEQAQRKQQ
jgi:hypothetical protein